MSFDADADADEEAERLLDLNIETRCVPWRSCLIDNDAGVLADEQLLQGIGLFEVDRTPSRHNFGRTVSTFEDSAWERDPTGSC